MQRDLDVLVIGAGACGLAAAIAASDAGVSVAEAQYFGARGSIGEAVLWGNELGAALGNIGAYQGYAAVSDPHGSLLSWTTIEKGGMIVNGAGHRFGDESAGYSGFTPNVLAQHGPCFAIFDQKVFDVTAAEEDSSSW